MEQLLGEVAAVWVQNFASEIGRFVARQKQRGIRDFIRDAFASHRNIRKKLCQSILWEQINHARHMRIDVPGTYRVHPDPRRC